MQTPQGNRTRGRRLSPLAAAMWLLLAPAAAAATTHCFEAEHANNLTLPFEIVEREDASGGLALSIPEGAGDHSALAGDTGTATFRVSVRQAGARWLWVRVRWNGHCSNSVIVAVGRKRRAVISKTLGRWHWCRAWAWVFPAGVTEIQLRNREDGVWVDQVLVTDDAKFRPPDGPYKADTIPGKPEGEAPEPSVFLTGASGGLPLLPPTDFKLHHKGRPKVRLDRVGCAVVRSKGAAPVVVWLRNNSLAETDGTVTLATPAALTMRPGAEQRFRFAAGVPLKKVTFLVSPGPQMPRRLYPLFIRVRHRSGKVAGHRMWLVRPYQWLVTNALPCPETSGIETRCPLEAQLARGFPGPAEGVSWKQAAEEAVTPFGLLDLRRAVADRTYVFAYAYTRVSCPKEGEYLLDVRHDDMIRVWLNGACVFTCVRCAPSVQTRKLVKVKLRAGGNDLLVKLCQGRNYWEFGATFLTLDRKPAAVSGGEVASLLKTGGRR